MLAERGRGAATDTWAATGGHPAEVLTARQREIAALVARGYTNRQIAAELVLTAGTVANHIQQILRRLDADSRTQVAAWAIEHGLSATQDRLLTTLERLLEIDTSSFRGALAALARLLAEALPAERAAIYVYDPALDALVITGISDTHARAPGLPGVVPLSEPGAIAATFRQGLVHAVPHAGSARRDARSGAREMGSRCAVLVPFEVDKVRRGVLAVTSNRLDTFRARDVRFLAAAARWVGMLAQRAEMVEQAIASAVELARSAATQEVVGTLAEDLGRRTVPLTREVQLFSRRAQHTGRRRDMGAAQKIAHAVGDLDRLASDLSDAARLERGSFELNLQPVDLLDLVRATIAPFRRARFDVRVHAPYAIRVRADRARLRQAFEHLVAEAGRHLEDGGAVAIDLNVLRQPDGTRQAVATISTATRLRARGSEVVAAGEVGRGVGLQLSRRIVAVHGGSLRVEQGHDARVQFVLTLPLTEPRRA